MKDKFEELKTWTIAHKDEIIVGCVASAATYFLTKSVYKRDVKKFVEEINADLMEMFTENKGNFQKSDGENFLYPQITKE